MTRIANGADKCAFTHRIGMVCGGLRRDHGTRYIEHDFVEPKPKCLCGRGRYSYVEPNCPVHGAAPALTEPESQLVIGAMPLQGLPNGSDVGEEWELGPESITGGVLCQDVLVKGMDRFAGGYICSPTSARAAQIVRNHHLAGLAGLVPGLVSALVGLKQRHGCWCELPPNAGSPDHTVECEQAQHALNTLSKEQGDSSQSD